MINNRVVITGMGAICPLGQSVDELWQNLIEGRNGISRISLFDASDLPSQIAGEVREFDPVARFGKREARRLDRFTQFTLVAGAEAVEAAGLTNPTLNRTRIGVVVGSGIGGTTTTAEQVETVYQRGPRRVTPFFIPMILPDSAAARLAIEYGFRGPSMSITSACATGNNALGEAFEMLVRGAADVIVAGGTDASLNLPILAGFGIMKALSTRNDSPETASRPFDAERDGFVAAEGAGVLVLERLDHALARKAPILAEFVGYGTSVDAQHMVAPEAEGTGAVLAIEAALRRANLPATAIDYINAHGTSTALNDATETTAIKKALGQHAYHIPISSIKSMTGHMLGGAGGIEAIAAVKTIQTGLIPPTINYHTPDPDCDLDYVPNTARRQQVQVVMSNGFGFGGHNATIILKQYQPQEN